MRRGIVLALLMGAGGALVGCETLPEGALGGMGDIGREVFGDAADEVATSASAQMIRDAADSMCSSDNTMCRNLTVTTLSGFTEAFIERLKESDVRRINEARERSIATGETQTWENGETGASGSVSSEPAEPRPPEPTVVDVKKDRVESLPMMDAVGQRYVVTAEGGVNVRGGPGTSYEIVDRLASSERIRAIGKVRDDNWYLVGRGNVGLGYVSGNLIQPWTPPVDQPLDEAFEPQEEPEEQDVAQVEVEMASECFTTTQTVTLASGETQEATVTSCRTPNGWATV